MELNIEKLQYSWSISVLESTTKIRLYVYYQLDNYETLKNVSDDHFK